jgi:radical SAM modification target selenobiotic family peptide
MIKKTLATLCLTSLVAGTTFAAVSPEEAARLGKDLTPVGAEMAGNADGSIPPWNPEGTPVPAAFVPDSDNYISPYSDEKPLYTIDGNNWQEYADILTVGTRAMF